MNFRKSLLWAVLCTILLLRIIPSAKAQVGSYAFAQSNTTYTPLSNPKILATATSSNSLDSRVDSITSFPFTFYFSGVARNKCYISSNGFIAFGIPPDTSVYMPLSAPMTGATGAIAAWGHNINSVFNISSGNNTYTGQISWDSLGTAPNRRIVFEWKAFRPTQTSSTTDAYLFDFQIILEETTNKVSVCYGGLLGYAVGSTLYTGGAQIGLRGITNSDYNNRANSLSTAFTSSAAGTSNLSNQVFNTSTTLAGMPSSGLTYSWTPASCLSPLNVTASALVTTATLNWTAQAPAPASGYKYEVRASGAAGSGSVGLAASGVTAAGITNAAVTGLSASSVYTVYVQANCGPTAGLSSWSSGYSFSTLCNLYNTPYAEGFNNGISPTCWLNSNLSSNTMPNSFWYFTGIPGYNAANNGRPAGSYTWVDASSPSGVVVTLTSPVLNLSNLTTPYVKFDWFKDNPFIASVNNELKLEGYNGTNWISLFNNNSNRSIWRTEGISLPTSFIGATYAQFRFSANKINMGNQTDDILLDSFSVINTPPCIVPNIVNVSTITFTSATVSWAASGSSPSSGYGYEVRTSGAAGSGSIGLVTSGVTAAGVTSAGITGLSASSVYTVYVKADCGSNAGLSSWSIGFRFVTPCGALLAPFSENFNSGLLPHCWTNSNSANSTNVTNLFWYFSGSSSYGTSNNGRTPGTYAWVDALSPYNVAVILTSPVLNLSNLTTPYVSFDWFKNMPFYAVNCPNNSLQLEGYNGTTWVNLFSDSSNSSSWRTQKITLPASFNGVTNAQFRFKAYRTQSCSYDQILLDDFVVESCASPVPVVALGADTAFCAGNSVTLNAGSTAAAYLWSTGNTTQTISVNSSGSYAVQVSNTSGCTSTDTIKVTVNSLPVVTLGRDTTFCAGNSITLNAGNSGADYLWSTSDTTKIISVNSSGVYTVHLNDTNNCAGTDTIKVTVNPLPIVSLGADTAFCAGNSVTLTAGSTAAAYLWSTSDTTQTISVNSSGSYAVQLIDTNSCVGTDTVSISVMSLPVAGVITVTDQAPTFTFAVSANQNDSTRRFSFGDGTIDTTGSLTVSHTYSQNGNYTVVFYAMNSCGIDSVTATITIENASVNSTVLAESLKLFPNPASEVIYIVNNATESIEHIALLNVLGTVVREVKAVNGKQERIYTDGLADGSYLVRIQFKSTIVTRHLNIVR